MKSVIDLAEQVKDYAAAGKTIAPVENGTTAVGSYAIGEKFIREGVLYKAKTSITVGDTLTLNTNYELEDNVVTQISDVKQALSNEVTTRAELGAHNLLDMSKAIIVNNGLSTATINSDGTVFVNGTTTGQSYFPSVPSGTKLIGTIYDLKPNTTYKLSTGIAANAEIFLQVFVKETSSSSWEILATNIGYAELEFTTPATFYEIWARITLNEGATFSNVTFKPMIRLATDTDPTYQPYAMTNKELTDVAKQIVGGYMLKSYSSVTVKADGTKTYKTLLNELYAAISQLFTSNPNSYIKILTLRASSNYYPIYVVPQLRTTVPSNWLFQGFTFGSTNYISTFSVESSNSSVIRFTLDAGTQEDISTDVPSSGTTFIVQYEIYKQIS